MLFGWVGDYQFLKSVLLQAISMKANTAVGLGFFSLALFFLHVKKVLPLSFFFSTAAALTAGFTLYQYTSNQNFGIDELLFTDTDFTKGLFPPGRMAPITGLCFLFLYLAFLLGDNPWKKFPRASQCMDFIVFVIAIQGFIAALTGISSLFGYAFYTQMAIHTSFSFIFLSAGHFALRPEEGFAVLLGSSGPAGKAARMLFFTVIALPPAMNTLVLLGEKNELFAGDASSLVRVTGSVVILVLVVLKAVAELQQSQEKILQSDEHLRKTRDHLQRAMNFAPLVIWSTDHAGVFTHLEGKGLGPLGIKPVDFVGKSTFELFTEDSDTAVAVRTALTGKTVQYQAEYNARLVDTILAPVKDAQDAVTGLIGITVDVTAKRIADEELAKQVELRKQKETAEASTKAKSAFLANMSHEVRTPINGLMGISWLLLQTELDSEQKDYATRIKKAADSLQRIVNDILDFSKLEAGQLTLDNQFFSLKDAVKTSLETFELQARTKGIELLSSIDPVIADEQYGDSGRLQQILSNLLSNAIKFTASGSVRVSIRPSAESKKHIHFKVQDTGIGISSEALPLIFDRFHQADSSTTRIFGGTGLGLSICKNLVELMGGKISCQTEQGKGSTFSFSLDLRISARPRREIKSLDANTKESLGLNILIAEDDNTNQEIFRRMLERLGCNTRTVANGVDALAALEEEDFDLIVMDCQMPLLDGYATTRKIRQSPHARMKAVPIIAVTANAIPGSREKCVSAGMTDFLAKPFRFEDFRRVILSAKNK